MSALVCLSLFIVAVLIFAFTALFRTCSTLLAPVQVSASGISPYTLLALRRTAVGIAAIDGWSFLYALAWYFIPFALRTRASISSNIKLMYSLLLVNACVTNFRFTLSVIASARGASCFYEGRLTLHNYVRFIFHTLWSALWFTAFFFFLARSSKAQKS